MRSVRGATGATVEVRGRVTVTAGVATLSVAGAALVALGRTVGSAVAVSVGGNVGVSVRVGVAVSVGVRVKVLVAVAVSVAVDVNVAVSVEVGDDVDVSVGIAVGESSLASTVPQRIFTKLIVKRNNASTAKRRVERRAESMGRILT